MDGDDQQRCGQAAQIQHRAAILSHAPHLRAPACHTVAIKPPALSPDTCTAAGKARMAVFARHIKHLGRAPACKAALLGPHFAQKSGIFLQTQAVLLNQLCMRCPT